MLRLKYVVGSVVPLVLWVGLAALPASAAPNGKIAFEQDTEDMPVYPRVMTVDPFGTPPVAATLVLDSYWAPPAPSWSPDGRRIVFANGAFGEDSGLPSDLWTVDGDLSQPQQLTHTPDVAETEPAWAPDGRRIAYVADGKIWVLHLRSGRSVQISPDGVTDDEPTWSPNARKLAFERDTGGATGWEIYKVRATPGATARRVTVLSGDDLAPSWSPDGRRIAWERRPLGHTTARAKIWVMRRDGLAKRPLTPGLHPSWSPNGRLIAFTRYTCPGNFCPVALSSVWTRNLSDGHERLITRGLNPDWGRRPTVR
jgi:Tol biopolymer transport system component